MEGFTPRDTDVLSSAILAKVALIAVTVAPTTIAHGYACVGNVLDMGARYVNVLGRITGTTPAAMQGYLYWWDTAAAMWFPGKGLTFHTDAEILADATGVKSNVHLVRRPASASRIMLHFAAGPDTTVSIMNVTITKDT